MLNSSSRTHDLPISTAELRDTGRRQSIKLSLADNYPTILGTLRKWTTVGWDGWMRIPETLDEYGRKARIF